MLWTCGLILLSCTKEPSKDMISMAIKKSVKYDQKFWDISHVTVTEKIKNSSFDSDVEFCEDIQATFRLSLNKNCYFNNYSLLDNNVVVSWLKNLVKVDAIAVKVYDESVCIDELEINKEMSEEVKKIESQIGKAKCYDLINQEPCQLSKIFTKEMADEKIQILKDDVTYSLGKMKLYNKGYSENMNTKFRLCYLRKGAWEYWETL